MTFKHKPMRIKECYFTFPYIGPHDGDILVPVSSGLLVNKAQGVH